MIEKYNNFYEDLLIENMINESVIYFSEKLNKALSYINNDISKDLLEIQATNISQDVTMVDISKDGYFSYSTERNATNNMNDVISTSNSEYLFSNDINRDNNPIEYINFANSVMRNKILKSRNKIKIGRLINKLFPNKYNSVQLEDFTEKIKASIKRYEEHFELVEGEDIDKWYWYKNYMEMTGTLGNSCMSRKTDIFDIYNKNKDICKLLILLKEDKLIGRALVWKLNTIETNALVDCKDIVYFMDRQYTIQQSDVVKFRNYADEQGWCYKANNNHYSYKEVKYKNKNFNSDMTIKLNPIEYKSFPYMDTFRRYDPDSNILFNDNDSDSDNAGNYILDDTSGGYTEIGNDVWSSYCGESIPTDQAVWSDPLSDYLWRDDSIEVSRGSNYNLGWYPDGYDDIVEDIDGYYVHIDDVVWSGIEDAYILSEDAISIVTDINEYGRANSFDDDYVKDDYKNKVSLNELDSVFWYNYVSTNHNTWDDYDYIDKDLLTFNYKKEYILKRFAETAFKVKNSEEYLISVDALILDKDIDLNDKRIIDLFEYTTNIDSKKILEKGKKLKKILSDNKDNKNQLHIEFGDENDDNYLKSIDFNIDRISNRLRFIENF